MGVIRRQRQPVQLPIGEPSVGEAVETLRERRRGAGHHLRLIVHVHDDGRVSARIPGSRTSNPPALKGQIETVGGTVTLNGVIRESVASVCIPRMFTGFGVLFILVAILLIVVSNPLPGSVVCFIAGILFGGLGYLLARLRRSSFSFDCTQLLKRLTSLLPAEHPHRLP